MDALKRAISTQHSVKSFQLYSLCKFASFLQGGGKCKKYLLNLTVLIYYRIIVNIAPMKSFPILQLIMSKG